MTPPVPLLQQRCRAYDELVIHIVRTYFAQGEQILNLGNHASYPDFLPLAFAQMEKDKIIMRRGQFTFIVRPDVKLVDFPDRRSECGWIGRYFEGANFDSETESAIESIMQYSKMHDKDPYRPPSTEKRGLSTESEQKDIASLHGVKRRRIYDESSSGSDPSSPILMQTPAPSLPSDAFMLDGPEPGNPSARELDTASYTISAADIEEREKKFVLPDNCQKVLVGLRKDFPDDLFEAREELHNSEEAIALYCHECEGQKFLFVPYKSSMRNVLEPHLISAKHTWNFTSRLRKQGITPRETAKVKKREEAMIRYAEQRKNADPQPYWIAEYFATVSESSAVAEDAMEFEALMEVKMEENSGTNEGHTEVSSRTGTQHGNTSTDETTQTSEETPINPEEDELDLLPTTFFDMAKRIVALEKVISDTTAQPLASGQQAPSKVHLAEHQAVSSILSKVNQKMEQIEKQEKRFEKQILSMSTAEAKSKGLVDRFENLEKADNKLTSRLGKLSESAKRTADNYVYMEKISLCQTEDIAALRVTLDEYKDKNEKLEAMVSKNDTEMREMAAKLEQMQQSLSQNTELDSNLNATNKAKHALKLIHKRSLPPKRERDEVKDSDGIGPRIEDLPEEDRETVMAIFKALKKSCRVEGKATSPPQSQVSTESKGKEPATPKTHSKTRKPSDTSGSSMLLTPSSPTPTTSKNLRAGAEATPTRPGRRAKKVTDYTKFYLGKDPYYRENEDSD